VGCGRQDRVWGALYEGNGIILVPAILLILYLLILFPDMHDFTFIHIEQHLPLLRPSDQLKQIAQQPIELKRYCGKFVALEYNLT